MKVHPGGIRLCRVHPGCATLRSPAPMSKTVDVILAVSGERSGPVFKGNGRQSGVIGQLKHAETEETWTIAVMGFDGFVMVCYGSFVENVCRACSRLSRGSTILTMLRLCLVWTCVRHMKYLFRCGKSM